MRITGGLFKGRHLKTPRTEAVRPTTDRLREAVFNSLGTKVRGSIFMDAYAGSGAVGIEALSRGAAQVIFIEKHPEALKVLKQNLANLDCWDRVKILRGDVFRYLGKVPADIIYIDPPYRNVEDYLKAFKKLSNQPPQILIMQHLPQHQLPERYEPFQLVKQLKHGGNLLSFYEPVVD